ncbi:MAG TPA: hypothetical protein VJB90_04200 [Candidatus Nanoarchaeia archaeon]|nr:hypothetical protein [Candidatus Nanoarchaeia archaeon]
MKNKGQSATELMILIGVLLIVCVAVLSQSLGRESITLNYRQELSAKEIASSLAFSINQIALSGSNSATDIFLPSSITDNTPYTISISKNIVSITYSNRQAQSSLITSNITSVPLASGNKYTIKNLNGLVQIA